MTSGDAASVSGLILEFPTHISYQPGMLSLCSRCGELSLARGPTPCMKVLSHFSCHIESVFILTVP